MSKVEVNFVEKHIEVAPPKRPKKLTATRFASIFGLNTWNTPFKTWCEMAKVYQEPFVDNKYTRAGKVIEPKVISYLNKVYFLDLKSPEDIYGKDYFKQTRGDFFPQDDILGGMWDAISEDTVVEIKTTKRAEDWEDGIPVYYELQACLYAYLLGIDDVIVTCSFLEENDYMFPEKYVPTSDNTIVEQFSLSEKYPDFEEEYIESARRWWRMHIDKGVSPDIDPKKDKDIVTELQTRDITVTDENIKEKLKEYEELSKKVNDIKAGIKDDEDALKKVAEEIKGYLKDGMSEKDMNTRITTPSTIFTLSRSIRQDVDKTKLKKDKLLDKYTKPKEIMTLRTKGNGEVQV